MKRSTLYLLLALLCILESCANQLPPPGGPDDRDAPEILAVSPRPGSRNFKGNQITIRFNEHVDKRSFIESFSIYPEPAGGSEINWNGKDVTVEFSRPLLKNTTYVITVGKDLKDLRGGNALPVPAIFAFSTGDKIDSGRISGIVVPEATDRTKLLLYRIGTGPAPDPSNIKADYVIQPAASGSFLLPFLPDGRYRIFAIDDEDRNSFYGSDFEEIGIASFDPEISGGNHVNDVYLFIRDLYDEPSGNRFERNLKADSSGKVFSSILYEGRQFHQMSKLYFLFKDVVASKQDIVSGFTLTDSSGGNTYKPVFNWISDSLLEVFSPEKFRAGSAVIVSIETNDVAGGILFRASFSVSGEEVSSVVSGRVFRADSSYTGIRLILAEKENGETMLNISPDETGRFSFRNVPEGSYRLIVFEDRNGNGRFDRGRAEPFEYSERAKLYDKDVSVKSGWNVEDIILDF